MVNKVLDYGNSVDGRNGIIKTLPFQILDIELQDGYAPVITTRLINANSVAGEYAAMIRGVKHLNDFKKWGCGYWSKWADKDGNLTIDYGKDFAEQGEYIIKALRSGEHNRRLIMNFWDSKRVLNNELSLPCCFYSMQFYKQNDRLHLLWNQRSADLLVGVPHDIVWAYIMLHQFAAKANLKAGNIKMVFGDAHIYEEHFENAKIQLSRQILDEPKCTIDSSGALMNFLPSDFKLEGYEHQGKLDYEIKL